MNRIAGIAGISVPTTFSAADREGDFFQYNLKVLAVNMRPKTPDVRLEEFTVMWEKFIAPNIEAMGQAGVAVDWETLFVLLADMTHSDDLRRIIVSGGEDLRDQKPPVGERPLQASHTVRENIRTNRPGTTAPGQDNAFANALLGAGKNTANAA